MNKLGLILLLLALSVEGKNPYDGSVRLIGGPHEDEGVAQMYLNGQWGYICDSPGFSTRGWASVFCKTKNGKNSVATEAIFVKKKAKKDSSFEDLIPPEGALMTFQMPDCYPREVDKMIDCGTNRKTGETVCIKAHKRVVYIKCENEDGDVRLIGGPNADEGVAQMYLNQSWGYICDGPGFSVRGWPSVFCITKNGENGVATEAIFVKKKAKEDETFKALIPPEGTLMTFQMPDCRPGEAGKIIDCLTNRRTGRTDCDPNPHNKVVYVKCENTED